MADAPELVKAFDSMLNLRRLKRARPRPNVPPKDTRRPLPLYSRACTRAQGGPAQWILLIRLLTWLLSILHIILCMLQPTPVNMRLEMVNEVQIEILNGWQILVNYSKSRNSNSSVSRSTNLDFDWIWISLYLAVQI